MIKINIFSYTSNSHITQGTSGGDTRFVTILQHLLKRKLIKLNVYGTQEIVRKFNIYNTDKQHINFTIYNTKLFHNSSITLTAYSLLILMINFIKIIKIKNSANTYIYGTSDMFWEVIPCLINKLKNKKSPYVQCIYHIYPKWKNRQGNSITNLLSTFIQKISHAIIKKYADKIIVINPITKYQLIKTGFKKEKIFINYCGVENYKKMANKKLYEGISIARFSPSKGIHDIVSCWHQVTQKLPTAKIVLVGGNLNDKYYVETLKLIEKYNLTKNIIIKGYVSEREKIKLLQQSKVFLTCSIEEGFNITILEAINNKVPVIAYGLPIYNKIFKKNIKNVRHTPKSMATTIQDILNSKIKTKINNNFINQFNWENISLQEYEIIFSK